MQSLCLDSDGTGPCVGNGSTTKGNLFRKAGSGVVSKTCYPTFRRYRQEDPESRASLGCYMRPCIKEGIQTLRLHPRPAANTGLYKDDVSCTPHKHNFTPGPNQGQHSWGEGNRKGLKEGRKTVSPWRPCRLAFSSASRVLAWGISPLLQACRYVRAEWPEIAWTGTGL